VYKFYSTLYKRIKKIKNQALSEEERHPNYRLLRKVATPHSESLSNITQELSTVSLTTEEDEFIAQQEIPYEQPDKS